MLGCDERSNKQTLYWAHITLLCIARDSSRQQPREDSVLVELDANAAAHRRLCTTCETTRCCSMLQTAATVMSFDQGSRQPVS